LLPFSKRTRPEDAAEVINTGEFEVVQGVPAGAMPSFGGYANAKNVTTPSATRPRIVRSDSDDDRTVVMPQKMMMSRSSPPPRMGASNPLPTPKAPPGAPVRTELARPRPPTHFNNDERTIVRPMSLGGSARGQGHEAHPYGHEPRRDTRPPAVPASALALGAAATVAARPVAAPNKTPSVPPPSSRRAMGPDSDPRVDLPPTVITTRTRTVSVGRPTFSWSAALVAMGVFVGLVSAVVARGDTDALIEATASFVDPSHTSSVKVARAAAAPGALVAAMPVKVAAAGAASQAVGAMAAGPSEAAPVPSSASCPTPELEKDGVRPAKADAKADAKVADAKAVESLPRAQPAPAPRRVWSAPRPAPRPSLPAVAVAPSRPTVQAQQVLAQRAAPASRPAAPAPAHPAATENDMESASAADALARAQLEASLH
jgi:hypothetical protein